MLVLSRKSKERIEIGDSIVITVLEIGATEFSSGLTLPGPTMCEDLEFWPLQL